jgi:CheY-like chemotaxis protein
MCISVEDTGIGIGPDTLPRLFRDFSQGDSSTSRRFGGTGLGLAICKRLTEAMGGQLDVHSRTGSGSTFVLHLPFPLSPPPDCTPASWNLRGLQVLVVDPSPLSRNVMAELLASWGLRCDACASPQEAVDHFRKASETSCDFVIIGAHRSAAEGIAVAQSIRTEIAALTTFGTGDDAARFQAAGFAAHLVKPVRSSLLCDTLTTAWSRNVSVPGEPAAPPNQPASSSWRHCRVLVAEDNQINQRVARAFLEKLGCQVDMAGNGREVVEMWRRRAYRAIFMDCFMPELDGYEATRLIRSEDSTVPIIAMTANAMPGDRGQCLAAGMSDYIAKPLRVDDLARMLAVWVASPLCNL